MFKNKFSTLTRNKSKTYEEIHYTCTIRFLDDSVPITVTYQKDTKGQWLIDYVCRELNLVEKDYFGLRFVDSDKQRHWLDPFKSVYRQLKQCFRNEGSMSGLSNNADVNPMVLCFRVKFYPTDPMKLREEITRYFLFLQLRRDLHHGRLLCTPADANQLAAYIIQSEVGDYDPDDHPPGYVSEFKMLPKQTQKQEEKIAEIHKTLAGQVPAEAEGNFLKKACTLDTYGVDPHPVKSLSDYLYLPSLMKPKLGATSWPGYRDQKGNQMYLGVTHLGIVTFQGNKRTHLFKWPQINKIAFEGKMFIVHVTMSEGEESTLIYKRKKHACGFKCPTFSACKHLWKCAVEQQYFFTLNASQEAPKVTSGGGIFTRGSKFRFSGRCQKEVYAESANIKRDPPQFVRSASNPQFVRSYNHVRSVSMPLRLKEKSVDDVMVTNHVSASELPLTGRNLSQEAIEDTIPEEKAVPVSDVPYAPLESPTKEDLPPLPSDRLGPDAHSDLDAQIHELQQELDKCRMADESSNHIQERPIDVGVITPEKNTNLKTEAATPNTTTDTPTPTPTSTDSLPAPDTVTDTEKKPSRRRACCVAFLVSLTIAFLILLAIFVLALESDLQVPVVRDIREWPAVSHFKYNQYDPMKASIGQKVGGWFKT